LTGSKFDGFDSGLKEFVFLFVLWSISIFQPAVIVSTDVVPSWLNFVMSGPEERTGEMISEGVDKALSNSVDFIIIEKFGIRRALSILNADIVCIGSSIWTKNWSSSIKVGGKFSWKI
jgi:hypothetical protein